MIDWKFFFLFIGMSLVGLLFAYFISIAVTTLPLWVGVFILIALFVGLGLFFSYRGPR